MKRTFHDGFNLDSEVKKLKLTTNAVILQEALESIDTIELGMSSNIFFKHTYDRFLILKNSEFFEVGLFDDFFKEFTSKTTTLYQKEEFILDLIKIIYKIDLTIVKLIPNETFNTIN